LVEQVFREISAALTDGKHVKLSGFGVFTVRQKSRRIGRNPKTGVAVPIEPRQSLTFSSSRLLRTRVTSGLSEPRSRRDRKEPRGLTHSTTE
jgi:integration host factor subunit alpha